MSAGESTPADRVVAEGPGWQMVQRESDFSTFVRCESLEVAEAVKRVLFKGLTAAAGESTPAPASVERAASQAGKVAVEEYPHGAWSPGAYVLIAYGERCYRRGQDAAAADRAALARANGLLREALKYLLCGGDLSTRITDHLDGKTPPPTPSPSRSP